MFISLRLIITFCFFILGLVPAIPAANSLTVPLMIWIVLTIGWLGFASLFVWQLWPHYRFFRTPDNLLIDGMARMHITEFLEFALVPPIALLLIGWVVLWAVRGSRR